MNQITQKAKSDKKTIFQKKKFKFCLNAMCFLRPQQHRETWEKEYVFIRATLVIALDDLKVLFHRKNLLLF